MLRDGTAAFVLRARDTIKETDKWALKWHDERDRYRDELERLRDIVCEQDADCIDRVLGEAKKHVDGAEDVT